MAVSTKLVQQNPWDDPNAYNGGFDPNTYQPLQVPQPPVAPDAGGSTSTKPGTYGSTPAPTPTDTGATNTNGGLTVLPGGTPVPPVIKTEDNGGYGGSYPIDPNITGTGRGWDELNKMFDQGPIVGGADPRLLKFQGMSDEALEQILHGPNRLDLAKNYYDIFDKQTEGDYQRDLKNATNLGAARGRLGSGLLTNTYGDLFERRASDKDVTKQRLLTDALEGTIGDRQRAFDAVSNAEKNAFGEGATLRDEARTERDKRRQLINDWFNQQQGAYSREFDERKYGDTLASQGRDEARRDREYNDSVAQQDLLNRIKQREQELAEQQARWNHDYQLWQMGNGPYPGPRPS